jgi:dienelactone hydrolase
MTLAALAILGGPASAQADKSDDGPKPEVKHFLSGGQEIAVECFAPARAGEHSVLVTLHAVGGADGDDARPYHSVARMYTEQGYVIHLVHYFDRTEATRKDVVGYRELFVNHFQSKGPRAEDLKRIKALSDVDGERVALVGFSLGGGPALAAAARPEPKVAAVVEFFGTLPQELRPGLEKLPPTLIFHGEQDKVVPVDEAYALIGLLAARLPGDDWFAARRMSSLWRPPRLPTDWRNPYHGNHLSISGRPVTPVSRASPRLLSLILPLEYLRAGAFATPIGDALAEKNCRRLASVGGKPVGRCRDPGSWPDAHGAGN